MTFDEFVAWLQQECADAHMHAKKRDYGTGGTPHQESKEKVLREVLDRLWTVDRQEAV